MLKIHVDIGRLAARLGHETLEHHADRVGGNLGDAQRVADHRIRRRAPALTQNAPAAGEIDDIADGQKVGGEIQRLDDAQLLFHLAQRVGGHTVRKPLAQALRGQPLQAFLGGLAIGDFVWVFIAQFIQRKGTARGDFQRAAHRAGMIAKQPGHVGGGFQAALGIGQGAAADLVDRHALADAGQHIGQTAAARVMHQHIAHGDHRHGAALGGSRGGAQARTVAPVISGRGAQKHMAGEPPRHVAQQGVRRRMAQRIRRQGDQDHPLGSGLHIRQRQGAMPLGGAPLAKGQQSRQAGIGGAAGRQGQPVDGAVLQHQPRADDQPGQAGRGLNPITAARLAA